MSFITYLFGLFGFKLVSIDSQSTTSGFNVIWSEHDQINDTLLTIPNGWFVYELGQSMYDMTWYCQLLKHSDLSTDSITRVHSHHKSSLLDALCICIDKINCGNVIITELNDGFDEE